MRSTNAFVTTAIACFALATAGMISGCKSDDAAPAAKSSSASETKPAPAKSAEPPKGVVPPANSKLSKVKSDMNPQQVQEIMGAPTGQAAYPTGKSFAPFQYGNDSGNRVEYKYKGQGRVVFATPRWGGDMKVVRVDYDPAEDGN